MCVSQTAGPPRNSGTAGQSKRSRVSLNVSPSWTPGAEREVPLPLLQEASKTPGLFKSNCFSPLLLWRWHWPAVRLFRVHVIHAFKENSTHCSLFFSFLLFLVGYIYIFKTLSFFITFFIFIIILFFFILFFYRGVFSILLLSIAHNLTNVKCTAAWLVQPFKHEPGRYRPSFQQKKQNKHDMQLKRVVLFGGKISKLLTALHGSVSLWFFLFFFLPSNMQVVHFSAVWKAGTCEVSICLFETDDVSSTRHATWQTLPRMASQSDSPYYCTPLPRIQHDFYSITEDLCTWGRFFFLFCIKVKSTIFGIVTRNQGTM